MQSNFYPSSIKEKSSSSKFLTSMLFMVALMLTLFTQRTSAQQPTNLGTQLVNGSYVQYGLNDLGAFRQVRLQAASTASGRNWEFYTGDYSNNWRPYTSGQTLNAFNAVINPATETASARYNSGFGGQSGLLPNVTSGLYYTWNVTENVTANNFMAVLETAYNPTTISSVSNASPLENVPTQVTVSLAASPSVGENAFVRYSTNGFASSSVVACSFTGSTGTATIPGLASGTVVSYYAFTSSMSLSQLNAAVTANGEVSYDMATLDLNNNGGSNYSFTITDTTPPSILTVSISSANTNSPSIAKAGDIISLSFTTDETPAVTPAATIQGNTASVTGSGTSWTASWTVVGGDTNGAVSFSITVEDAAANQATATTTTDASFVVIDTMAPAIAGVSIASNNVDPSIAEPGDVISLTFTTSETPSGTPVVTFNGNAATSVSGSGTSWSATYNVTGSDASGLVAFLITIEDAAGNTGSSSTTNDASSVTIVLCDPPTVSSAVTDESCAGSADGTITVNTTGGSGTFTYSLDGGTPQASNVFSGLAASSYTVTVIVNGDPGCTAAHSPTVGTIPDVTPPQFSGGCATEDTDGASYDNGWQSGDGNAPLLGTWVLSTTNASNAGHFLGSSTSNGDGDANSDGDINVGGEAFGLYANSGHTSSAVIPFDAIMLPGDSLSLDMDNGFVDALAVVGIGIQNASGENLWEFFFRGGTASYEVNQGGGAIFTGLGFTDEGLNIKLKMLTATTLEYTITRLIDDVSVTGTSTTISQGGGQAPAQLRLFNFNAGGASSNDAYFNSIELCHACAEAITVNNDPGLCGAAVTLSTPSVSDDCSVYPTTLTVTNNAPSLFPVGETIMTWTATDAAGNSATCTQSVTVIDNELPVASCNSTLTINLDITGNYTLTTTQVNNGSSDNCSSGAGLTLSLDRTAFTCADVGLGAIPVTLTVTDEAGNSSTCTSGVTVQSGGNCGPANDDCADAITLMPSLLGYSLWDTLSVSGSTQSLAGCIGNADDDTWYKWVAQSANEVVIVQDVNAVSDMVIEIYNGCAGTSLGCFDNYGAGVLERAYAGSLTVGNTYYFRTYDKASGGPASGQIRIMVKTFAKGDIRDVYCGITNYQMSDWFTPERQDLNQLYPFTTVSASGYEVKLTDQSTSLVYTKAKTGSQSQYFQFSNFVGLPFNSLFDAQARHSVNVPANGTIINLWSEYGDACTMGVGGVTQSAIRPQYCSGAVDFGLGDNLLAIYVPNATSYRFIFTEGSNTYVRTKSSYGLFLYDVPGLQYGKTYNVTVQVLVNGVWSASGAVCTINMLSQPPDTQVRAQYCNGTYLFPDNNYLLSDLVFGADLYQWRFTPSLGGTALIEYTGSLSFAFHITNLPFISGSTYNVDVRARVQGMWGDYANICPITIQANPEAQGSADNGISVLKALSLDNELNIYPNPSDGNDFIISMELSSDLASSAHIEIMDITGKIIYTERIAVKGQRIQFKTSLDQALETGIYLVRVSAGEFISTERLLISR